MSQPERALSPKQLEESLDTDGLAMELRAAALTSGDPVVRVAARLGTSEFLSNVYAWLKDENERGTPLSDLINGLNMFVSATYRTVFAATEIDNDDGYAGKKVAYAILKGINHQGLDDEGDTK